MLASLIHVRHSRAQSHQFEDLESAAGASAFYLSLRILSVFLDHRARGHYKDTCARKYSHYVHDDQASKKLDDVEDPSLMIGE